MSDPEPPREKDPQKGTPHYSTAAFVRFTVEMYGTIWPPPSHPTLYAQRKLLTSQHEERSKTLYTQNINRLLGAGHIRAPPIREARVLEYNLPYRVLLNLVYDGRSVLIDQQKMKELKTNVALSLRRSKASPRPGRFLKR